MNKFALFLQAEWSDLEKHKTAILLTCGLKERGKVSEPCNTMVQANPTCCTSTVDAMVYHVGWMDQEKGRLVCQKKPGNDLAGQTERKLLEMRQMLPGLSGS
jgi:uncharacterized protein YdeI (YjbR/CyaY-like superfamily)